MSVLATEVENDIAVVTLDRPAARNSLSPELIVRLSRCWHELRDSAAVRAVVLTASAGSTFCSGFDLGRTIPLYTKSTEPQDEWEEAVYADHSLMETATLRSFDLERPLIVAANGHAIAGGMELLLAGDIRVVASGAKLGLSEVKLGLIPAMGGTAKLARKLPPALAAEMLLTGDPISAEEGYRAGFINRVVPADAVRGEGLAFARTIATNAPLAVSAARTVMRRSVDCSEADALALESQYAEKLGATEDAIEGPRAFMEKRAPVFKGR